MTYMQIFSNSIYRIGCMGNRDREQLTELQSDWQRTLYISVYLLRVEDQIVRIETGEDTAERVARSRREAIVTGVNDEDLEVDELKARLCIAA